jgi:predicted nuclease with TOPRIM domain
MKNLPPIAAMLFLLTAGVIFAIGFFRHGVNFIKYGFKQLVLDSSLEKRFDDFERRFDDFEKRFDKLESRIEAIETNHFGHLKNYLGILNGVLLDKQIIDNETKARLDNEVRGM